jgi:hypothetical protein
MKNIAGALAGFVNDAELMDVESADDLLELYTKKPYLLASTHQMLLDAGADARLILQYGI